MPHGAGVSEGPDGAMIYYYARNRAEKENQPNPERASSLKGIDIFSLLSLKIYWQESKSADKKDARWC
ncbi:hypothetical protein KA005_34555 [bacterium]|nr:hypothetical protein [bacterium]